MSNFWSPETWIDRDFPLEDGVQRVDLRKYFLVHIDTCYSFFL